MIANCPCQQCGVNIEFEVENANQFVPCPSCGKETRLLLPESGRKIPKPAFAKSYVPPPKLVSCPDCGHKISRLALMCPNCGAGGYVRFRLVWGALCAFWLIGLIMGFLTWLILLVAGLFK